MSIPDQIVFIGIPSFFAIWIAICFLTSRSRFQKWRMRNHPAHDPENRIPGPTATQWQEIRVCKRCHAEGMDGWDNACGHCGHIGLIIAHEAAAKRNIWNGEKWVTQYRFR